MNSLEQALYAVLTITRDEPHEREIKVTVS